MEPGMEGSDDDAYDHHPNVAAADMNVITDATDNNVGTTSSSRIMSTKTKATSFKKQRTVKEKCFQEHVKAKAAVRRLAAAAAAAGSSKTTTIRTTRRCRAKHQNRVSNKANTSTGGDVSGVTGGGISSHQVKLRNKDDEENGILEASSDGFETTDDQNVYYRRPHHKNVTIDFHLSLSNHHNPMPASSVPSAFHHYYFSPLSENQSATYSCCSSSNDEDSGRNDEKHQQEEEEDELANSFFYPEYLCDAIRKATNASLITKNNMASSSNKANIKSQKLKVLRRA